MSRTVFPFAASDISALARSLKEQLNGCQETPGHVELLNMLARASGCRNFQDFRSRQCAQDYLDTPPPSAPPPEPVNAIHVKRLLRFFDGDGRLVRWPSKLSQQEICLWVVWSRLPPGEIGDEAHINRRLQAEHLFGDHALLRRWLCDYGMVKRTVDGREYRRIEQCPPPDARALIRAVHIRRRPAEARSTVR